VIRRIVTADGKSRAFVNDTSVGVSLLAELIDAEKELNCPRDILQVREGRLPVAPLRHQTAGDTCFAAFEGIERGVDLGGEMRAIEASELERSAPGGPQPGELLPPLLDQIAFSPRGAPVLVVVRHLSHRPRE